MRRERVPLPLPVRVLQVPELAGQYHAVHVLLRRKIGNILLFRSVEEALVKLVDRHGRRATEKQHASRRLVRQ